MPALRILLTCDPFLPVPPTHYGGVERIVASLLAELRRRGHCIGLIAHSESPAAVDYFLEFPRAWPKGKADAVRNSAALLRAVHDFKPCLIHSFSRLLYLAPLLLRRIPKIESYQRFPGGWQIPFAAALAGTSLNYTGCSEFIATMGRKHGGSWRAIPNFIDADSYDFVPRVADDAALVFLSRVESIKGAHLAIEIAKQTGRRLFIAGNHGDTGPEGEYWNGAIKPQLGRNGIEYVGPVDDKAKNDLLGAAAAMIVPIQWDEPFGIVFAEALACGTPVVTCPRGAAPEIVRDGVDGFLVDDVAQGCRAVHGIAAIDRRQCRARAEQMFSAAAVVPQYEALYREMLGVS